MLWVWSDGLIEHIKSMMTMTYFSLKKGLPSFDTCLNEGVRAVARQAFLGGIPMVFQKAPQLTVLLCYISNKNIHSHLSHFFGRIFFFLEPVSIPVNCLGRFTASSSSSNS